MQTIREWLHRLWWTVVPGRRDDDLDEELRSHIALAAEHGRREVGTAQAMEALRDQRGLPWLDTLTRDLQYGIRVLARSPMFTAVAILSLALGIGVNAAIFHLIDAVRLRTLPVARPQELVDIRPDGPQAFGSYQSVNATATYPLWQQTRAAQRAFTTVEAWGETTFLVGRGADRQPARGLWVSGNFFAMLGVTAERGRLIAAADDRRGCGAGPAVISHAFWQTHWGGAESVLGQTITVVDRSFTIVGVTPPSFTGLEVGRFFDVALPICSEEILGPTPDQRDRWWLTPIARLRPGWTVAQAGEHLQTISAAVFGATVPDGYDPKLTEAYRKLHLTASPGGRGISRLRDAYGRSLWLLLGLTTLLLLVTCGNLATLFLARASARERELAVRAALGASRRRLLLQLLMEGLLLAGAGATLAVPLAVTTARTLVAFLDTPTSPVVLTLTADWRVIGFIAAVAAVTVVIFCCAPALRLSFVNGAAAMSRTSRRLTLDRQRARFQRALVAVQVAISLVLVVAALMFVQTFRKLAAVDVGFDADHAVALALLDPSARHLDAQQTLAVQGQLAEAIRRVPGVTAAASATHVPLSGDVWSHFFRVSGSAGEQKASRFTYVSPEYFDTLRIPLRAGRMFTDRDDARSRPVMLVNESFADSHLAGRNPVGAVISRLEEPGFPAASYEIVGVVGNTKYADLRDEDCWCDGGAGPMPPIAYVPIAQQPSPARWSPVIVRTTPGVDVASSIAKAVRTLNPAIAVAPFDLTSQIRQRLAGDRLVAWLAGAFGVLAVLLVTIGLHGLIAYLAVSRTNEIGVRLSLGSTRSQIVSLVLRESVWMIALGVLIGVPVAVAAMRAAQALLFGLSPEDVPTVVASVIGLAVIAALAGAIPAWRASRLDPNVVLRAE